MPDSAEAASEPRTRIVVFGDVIDDVVAVPVCEIRADTDTPASIRFRAGGSAANMASWLGVLGADVDFVGRVGASDHARHSGLLRDAAVRPLLEADDLLPTGTIVVIVNGEHRNMLTERGANAVLDPDTVDDALLDGARAVHFTGYSLFGPRGSAGVTALIARARRLGVEVSVDPGSSGFLEDFGPSAFLEAVAGATYLFPNIDEGRVLTGLVEPLEVAAALARSFQIVALTLGTDGVVVAQAGHEPVFSAALEANIIDPTGAGDAFAAGFLSTWIQTADAAAAAVAGTQAGATAVTVIGGRPQA